MAWRVVTVKETTATGLRDDIGAIFRNHTATGECLEIIFVFGGFFQAREELESVLAEYVLALHAGDALHRAVPGGVAKLAVEGDDAVNVCLEQAFEKQVLFLGFVRHRLGKRKKFGTFNHCR